MPVPVSVPYSLSKIYRSGFDLILMLAVHSAKFSLCQDSITCSPDNPLTRMTPCNGHGECSPTYGLCVCDEGWSGFNCSTRDSPCQVGHTNFKLRCNRYGSVLIHSAGIPQSRTIDGTEWHTYASGSFADGTIGREVYANDLECVFYIRPQVCKRVCRRHLLLRHCRLHPGINSQR